MNTRRASRLASYFAVSNLGLMHHMNESRAVEGNWGTDPRNEMLQVAGHFIEEDAHEELFSDEAEGWFNDVKDLSIEEAREKFSWNVGRTWFDSILDFPEKKIEEMR